MSDASYQIFLRSVRETFQTWPILRIARQQGFGGKQPEEKVQWLCESVVQIFSDNVTVHADELEHFISEVLFNEFDTIAEDGSLPELAQRLCRYYGYCKLDNCQPVLEALSKFESLASAHAPKVQKVETLSDDEDEDGGFANNGQSDNGGHAVVTMDDEAMETNVEDKQPKVDADGWEVVSRSKRK